MNTEVKQNTFKRSVWKNLKSTYHYAKKGKKYLFWFLLINLLLTVVSVIIPVITAKRMILLTSGLFEKLLGIIIIIFAIEIFRNIVTYLYNHVYNKFYFVLERIYKLNLLEKH